MTDTFDTLITQLQSTDPFQRSQAIFQLRSSEIGDDRAVSALVSVLCTDNDLNVVEDATWVLVHYGAVATAILLNEVTHDNSYARHNIIHALGKIADSQALPALMVATQDTDASVRLKSVYALGQIGDAQAIDVLIMRLGDTVQDIRWTAREILEAFGKKALPQLIHALTMQSAQIRELSASLLGDIADNSTVEPLTSALETDNWQVRFASVEALGQIGDVRALPTINRMIDDVDPRVQAIAKTVSKILSMA